MMKSDDRWPDWLSQQRGKAYRGAGYMSRRVLIRNWVSHLQELGRPVTHDAIREMLVYVDRGYSLGADQISFALHRMFASGKVPKMPNGKSVTIEGETFASARQAALKFAVSPQTVLNRMASQDEKWKDWRHADQDGI